MEIEYSRRGRGAVITPKVMSHANVPAEVHVVIRTDQGQFICGNRSCPFRGDDIAAVRHTALFQFNVGRVSLT